MIVWCHINRDSNPTLAPPSEKPILWINVHSTWVEWWKSTTRCQPRNQRTMKQCEWSLKIDYLPHCDSQPRPFQLISERFWKNWMKSSHIKCLLYVQAKNKTNESALRGKCRVVALHKVIKAQTLITSEPEGETIWQNKDRIYVFRYVSSALVINSQAFVHAQIHVFLRHSLSLSLPTLQRFVPYSHPLSFLFSIHFFPTLPLSLPLSLPPSLSPHSFVKASKLADQ